MTKACSTCRYWKKFGQHGDCRAFPPVTGGRMRDTYGELMEWRQFPRTSHNDWCGHHSSQSGKSGDVF